MHRILIIVLVLFRDCFLCLFYFVLCMYICNVFIKFNKAAVFEGYKTPWLGISLVVSRGDLNGTSGCNCACQLPSVEGLTVQIGSLSGPECSHAIVKGMVIYLIAAVMGSELTVGFCKI